MERLEGFFEPYTWKKRIKRYPNNVLGVTVAEWHSFVIGTGTAAIAGPGLFATVLTVALANKRRVGHLGDLRKELGYGFGGFILVEYGPSILPTVLSYEPVIPGF